MTIVKRFPKSIQRFLMPLVKKLQNSSTHLRIKRNIILYAFSIIAFLILGAAVSEALSAPTVNIVKASDAPVLPNIDTTTGQNPTSQSSTDSSVSGDSSLSISTNNSAGTNVSGSTSPSTSTSISVNGQTIPVPKNGSLNYTKNQGDTTTHVNVNNNSDGASDNQDNSNIQVQINDNTMNEGSSTTNSN